MGSSGRYPRSASAVGVGDRRLHTTPCVSSAYVTLRAVAVVEWVTAVLSKRHRQSPASNPELCCNDRPKSIRHD